MSDLEMPSANVEQWITDHHDIPTLRGLPESGRPTADPGRRTRPDWPGDDLSLRVDLCAARQRNAANALERPLAMTRDQLVAKARRRRARTRAPRNSTGHVLCWHHPALRGLLRERTDPLPTVPTWPEFLRGCVQYRESLDRQLPGAP